MNRSWFAALAVAAVLWSALPVSARADQPYTFDRTPGALPKFVVPVAYDLALHPRVDTRTLSGVETIVVMARKTVPSMVLSELEIVVAEASVDGVAMRVSVDDAKQQVTLTPPRPLMAGRHVVRIAYAGRIGTQPQGLFVQPYTTTSGGKEEMLATQFESTDARRVFPCFDEPAFRATYRLTATVPAEFTAVSNMPVAFERVHGAEKTVTFACTPNMSTYLLVFLAGRFAKISGAVDGVALNVYAPHDRIERAGYALDAEKKLLAYYDDYFGIKYPLPKLDLIDIPGEFPGAMENWGGITFNERLLLFNPMVEPESAKVDIFELIAHEMSHQWTGDLVTMDWWSGLWLNEGFADWMETKASDHFNPSWHLWDRVESDVARAMTTDAKSTSHPIEQAVADDTQAGATFDEITYAKGGAVIRMMEQYLGEDTFRDGVRAYLRAHAYGNTTAADLWASLGTVAHRDVAALVDPWITQPGLPLVAVASTCADGRRTLRLAQHRFLVDAGDAGGTLWPIPVAIAAGGSPTYTLLDRPTATVDGGRCDGPLDVNVGALGYYRVQLDPNDASVRIARLAEASVAERARAVADADAMMLAGAQPAQLFATFAQLRPDDALSVWGSALGALREMSDLEVSGGGRAAYEAYELQLLAPVMQRVGWDPGPNDDAQTASLRSDLIEELGAAGDQATIAEAKRRFGRFLSDPASLPTALRMPVLDVVGTYADAVTWGRLRSLFVSAKSNTEAELFAVALWSARDPELARKNLQMAIDGSIPAEFGAVPGFRDVVLVAKLGRQPQLAWPFFQAHAKEMAAKLTAFQQPLLMSRIVPLFWNAVPQAELDAFIDGTPNLPASLIAKAKNDVALRLAQRSRLLPQIDASLRTAKVGVSR